MNFYATFFTHIHNSNLKTLVECVCGFYTPEEVAGARDQLLTECNSKLTDLNVKKTRRPTAPVDKQSAEPFAEDIVNWAGSLLNVNPVDLDVQFCALNLKKVPPCVPEEINVFSLAARLKALEERILPNQPVLEARVLALEELSARQNITKPSSSETLPKDPKTRKPGAPAGGVIETTSFKSSAQKDDWIQAPKNNRRRDSKNIVRAATKELTVIKGSAKDAAVQGSGPLKHLFAYKLQKGCSAESLAAHLQSHGIRAVDIRSTSKPNYTSASFKITLGEGDFRKAFQARCWPDGALCREWLPFVPRRPREEKRNSASSAAASADQGGNSPDRSADHADHGDSDGR